jgi:hypothetical protein
MDCELESDNTLNAYKGIVLPEEVPVIHTARKKVSSPVVMVRNGAVTVDFKKKTNYRLTAVNTLGKQVYSNKGYSETVAFNGRMAGNKAYSSGLLVVRISSVGNEFRIPLMQ